MMTAAMISLMKCSSEADAVVREMKPELLSKSLPHRITHCARSVYNHTPASCESFYVLETGKNLRSALAQWSRAQPVLVYASARGRNKEQHIQRKVIYVLGWLQMVLFAF